MFSHWNGNNESSTGEWIRLMIELEKEAAITVDPDDGMFVVGGVLKTDDPALALALVKEAA
jgi:hypothetical protein